jgi:two-component sensor histidine kinase
MDRAHQELSETGLGASLDVLVIDAVAARRETYSRLLDGLGCTVSVTGPGQDAQERIGTGVYAAILLRLDGDAESLQREIAAAAQAGAPIVAIAEKKPDLSRMGEDAGRAVRFVPSAFEADLLPAEVSHLIELQRLRMEFEDEQRLSLSLRQRVNEQIHRSKNLLTILQSVTRRTLQDGISVPHARELLIGRQGTLARAYQLVAASDGRGTNVADILESELGNVLHRVSMGGPAARLSGSAVQTFALAIHELASNAARYGALRSPEGTVAVSWSLLDNDVDRYLEVTWTEQGGSQPPASPCFGFGLSLVSSLGGRQASSEPNITFDPAGFACRMRFAQDVLVAG